MDVTANHSNGNGIDKHQAVEFLTNLYRQTDTVLFDTLNKDTRVWFNPVPECDDFESTIEEMASFNKDGGCVFFGLNPRKPNATGKAGTSHAVCYFADFDGTPPERALQTIKEAGMPEPSIVVASGGGTHVYWLLAEQEDDLVEWSNRMKWIAHALGGSCADHLPTPTNKSTEDEKKELKRLRKEVLARNGAADNGVCDIQRLARVPGFLNRKDEYSHCPPQTKLVKCDGNRRFSWKDLQPKCKMPAEGLPPAMPVKREKLEDELLPGKDFNARGDWKDVLGPGWSPIGPSDRGMTPYTNDPKGRRRKTATISEQTDEYEASIWIWDSDCTLLPANEFHSKFHAYTLIHHGGDYTKAASALRAKGFGQKASSKEPAPNICDSKNRKMVSECMAGIEPKEVVWFWKNRIPIGQLTLLTGPQGGTKSFLTMDLATRVSQGWPHPDGTGTCPQGQALFFTTEDEPATAIVPRLKACGADLTQIHYMHGTTDDPEDDNENARRLKLNTDIELLEEEIQRLGNVKLLIFDPLEDYIDGDSNNNKEVRTALTTLKAMAQRQDIAVVAVHHINKRSKDVSAVQTAGGAGAWTQVPRSVLHVVVDPDDDNVGFTRRRLMVCTKSNYGGDNQAQAYRLTEDQHPRIEWLPEVLEVCANSVIRSSTQSEDGRKKTDKREAAISDLYEIMQDGPVDSKDIDAKMRNQGHSDRQIRTARKECGLERVPRTANTDPHMWRLPEKLAVDDSTMDDFLNFDDGP